MSFDVAVERIFKSQKITMSFQSDEPVTALVGPSGSGKTTVLHMIAGIRRPDRGRIIVGGKMLFDSGAGVDVPAERRRCGYVFQDARLFPHMNVRENLLYGQKQATRGSALIDYQRLLATFELQGLEFRSPATLSGGESRRVAIGRTLLSNPSFLLLDEPLTSLDLDRRNEALMILERLRDLFRIPILYVTHHADEVSRIAGKVVEMPRGAATI